MYHAAMRLDSLKGYFPPSDAGIPLEASVKAYTIYAAQQMGISDITGSLKTGKSADFIVIDRDILQCNLEEVRKAQVLNTYFQGNKVY